MATKLLSALSGCLAIAQAVELHEDPQPAIESHED